jgi:hypothetical protein
MTLVLSALVAFADIPPPPGYVETCTTDRCGSHESRACGAYYAGREECEKLEKDGFVKVCQTRGASTWTEILCKGGADPAAVKAPDKALDPPASRCDTTAGLGAAGLGVLLAVGLLRRR